MRLTLVEELSIGMRKPRSASQSARSPSVNTPRCQFVAVDVTGAQASQLVPSV
jgi:hypothetical protein